MSSTTLNSLHISSTIIFTNPEIETNSNFDPNQDKKTEAQIGYLTGGHQAHSNCGAVFPS